MGTSSGPSNPPEPRLHDRPVRYPCIEDPTALRGLGPLISDSPRTWAKQMRDGPPELPRDAVDATLRQVLLSTVVEQLLPRHDGDAGRIRRYRSCARRLAGTAGHIKVSEVDQDLIEDIASTPDIAPSMAQRDASLLRRAVLDWAAWVGVEPQIAPIAPRNQAPAAGSNDSAYAPTLEAIQWLLADSPPQLRAAIGLVVGTGIREVELLQLRWRDFSPDLSSLKAYPRAASNDFRVTWVPPWTRDLLLALRPQAPHPDDWVFQGRHSGIPRGKFGRALTGACSRAETPGRMTMRDLRRTWQIHARAAGLSREVVRGSSLMSAAGDRWHVPQSPEDRSAAQWAASWKALGAPPVEVSAEQKFPARAPSGTRAWDPERDRTPQVPPPLPASCSGVGGSNGTLRHQTQR